MIEAAKQLRKLIEITAEGLTDEQASTMPYCFPVLKEGMEAEVGKRYTVRNGPVAIMSMEDDADSIHKELTLIKCTKTHKVTENEIQENSDLWEVL